MTSRPTRKRLWRKRLTRAILCLLLGAVTTVGVAWGCAVWAPEPDLVYHDTWGPRPTAWYAKQPAGWPQKADRTEVDATRFITHRSLSYGGWWNSSQELHEQEVVEGGWPVRAMFAVWHTETTYPTPNSFISKPIMSFSMERGLTVDWLVGSANTTSSRVPRALPMLPIWPGFLLNTFFYAAPWWLILITPRAVNRFRRRRRGRCIHCGYDLSGLRRDDNTTPTCPECGA